MKKWIITIVFALTLLALALATHFWGARAIKFAVENDKTVDSVKKLLELLSAIGGLAVPVIKWLIDQLLPPVKQADPPPPLEKYVPPCLLIAKQESMVAEAVRRGNSFTGR